jgi:hypothetical protein
MKNLAHPSFFRVADLLVAESNPGLKRSSWPHDGVAWEWERHSFTGLKHGLSIEIVTVTRPGRRGWSVMIVKEYWWIGSEGRALKALRRSKPTAGQSSDILDLFLAVKMATKFCGVLPLTRYFKFVPREGMYTTMMMSTGLTFGSISALFGLTNHIIDQAQYTILLTAVIGSAVVPTLIAQLWFHPHFEPLEEDA